MLSPILMWNKNRMHDEEEELYTFSDEYIVDEIILELQNQYL